MPRLPHKTEPEPLFYTDRRAAAPDSFQFFKEEETACTGQPFRIFLTVEPTTQHRVRDLSIVNFKPSKNDVCQL